MIFKSKEVKLRDGRTVILRSADKSDAENLIQYLRDTSAETPYLIREPDEVNITVENELHFINIKAEDPRELMLIAECKGEHIGNCSIAGIGSYKRYRHRCDLAIALYQKYCGLGLGEIMMTEALKAAKQAGYEQAELEVVAENTRAVHLYEKMGFQKYGTFPDNMKYADGSYSDAFWMMKKL